LASIVHEQECLCYSNISPKERIMRFWIHILEIALTLTLAALLAFSWRADRRERANLSAELAATKELLSSANARQQDRDAQLSKSLSALDQAKRATLTPRQIVQQLPQEIPLPLPISLEETPQSLANAPANANDARSASIKTPTSSDPVYLQAVIPAQDLKPLYDFSLDCKACQAKLTTSQANLADEKLKTSALTKERDHALQVARGGNSWQRIIRAAKWFILGATAGFLASKAAR
jgi:hypothetical protein